MNFKIKKASDLFDEYKPHKSAYKEGNAWYIHIRTLEDLIEFITEVGESIILDVDDIIIYDYYVE